MLDRTIHNAWYATSRYWFNAMDGRGPQGLEASIRTHQALMAWHRQRSIPVEGNEPYHWSMHDAPDVISVAASYLYAHHARRAGVQDCITTYMFESPPLLSNRMDLAKALAQIRVAESSADTDFRIWRRTRTGLLSYPVDPVRARAHLGESVYLQMALKPAIVHIVGYCEADHAATAAEIIESATMAQQVIETALNGQPDMLADPIIQERTEELVSEGLVLVEAIRNLAEDEANRTRGGLARAKVHGLMGGSQWALPTQLSTLVETQTQLRSCYSIAAPEFIPLFPRNAHRHGREESHRWRLLDRRYLIERQNLGQ